MCDSEYQHLINSDATCVGNIEPTNEIIYIWQASVASKILIRVNNRKSGISYTSIYVIIIKLYILVHMHRLLFLLNMQMIRLAFRFF